MSLSGGIAPDRIGVEVTDPAFGTGSVGFAWAHGTTGQKQRTAVLLATLDGGLTPERSVNRYILLIESQVGSGTSVATPDMEGLSETMSGPVPHFGPLFGALLLA
jgi:hypothetical protein